MDAQLKDKGIFCIAGSYMCILRIIYNKTIFYGRQEVGIQESILNCLEQKEIKILWNGFFDVLVLYFKENNSFK